MYSFWLSVKDTAFSCVSIAVTVIFVQNIVFTRALGISASMFVIRKKHDLWLFGITMAVISTLSCAIADFVLPPLSKSRFQYYLTPLCLVLIIGVVYILLILFCSRVMKKAYPRLQPMIHMAAFNGAVFGVLLLNNVKYTFTETIAFGLGTGIGYMMACYLIALGYERLNSEKIPPAFRGFPATMIYIGILSLAFYGLTGHGLSA